MTVKERQRTQIGGFEEQRRFEKRVQVLLVTVRRLQGTPRAERKHGGRNFEFLCGFDYFFFFSKIENALKSVCS